MRSGSMRWWLGLCLQLVGASPLLQASPAQAERRVVALSAAQLTQQLQPRFPQRNCLFSLACVTMADPVVRLPAGETRVLVQATVAPEVGGQVLSSGAVELAGRPRYDAAKGAFYLDEPALLRLEFPELAPAQAAQAAELTRGLLVQYFRQTPVWVLDEKDSQQALAKLVLRQVEVRDGALRFSIGDDD